MGLFIVLDSLSNGLDKLSKLLYLIVRMQVHMNNNPPVSTTERLIQDILSQDDIVLTVSSGAAICEAKAEKGMPFRILENWVTIGDENRPWHIHLNISEISEARFVKEKGHENKMNYSVRFADSKGEYKMRVYFTNIYNANGELDGEKLARYEGLFAKYGSREVIPLKRV